ncbi:F-box and associated interaction domains-containing protein [Euphorbia peplus]|nr:F-box and associated interaction domains-containing protein [Euphorbia peplus]
MQFARSGNHSPCLLLHDIENHLSTLHFSPNIVTITRLFVPMLPQFSVAGSSNGLLCLWDPFYSQEAYIFNPFTTVYIRLPKPKQFPTQQRVAIGFGFSLLTKEYKVVRIAYYTTHMIGQVEESEVEVLTVKNGNYVWRNKGKTSQHIRGEPSNILVNGRLHWLSYRSHRRGHQARVKIVSFDIDDEQFREVPNPTYKRFAVFCTHLVILRGCLGGVVKCWRQLDIWMMKEYGIQESWVKEFTIGYTLPREVPDRNLDFDVPNFLGNLSEARVLCMLKNGEIVLEHESRTLISYDVKNKCLKEIVVERGLPSFFKSIVHIGSLNSIHTPIIL